MDFADVLRLAPADRQDQGQHERKNNGSLMKKIVTHPDNIPLLESRMKEAGIDNEFSIALGIPIITNKYMERENKTGRIIAPDGTATKRKGWSWSDRFTVLEEQDLTWALKLGLVSEEMGPTFYIIDDRLLTTLRGF